MAASVVASMLRGRRAVAVAFLVVASSAFAPSSRRRPVGGPDGVALRAVDYEATLYASGPLGGADDATLAAWCAAWAARAVVGEGGGATVSLTTPVDVVARPDGVALLYRARATGYADKDRARERARGGDDDAAAAALPTGSREGGVAVVATGGEIRAVRCAYDGGVVKAMSEERLVDRLRADVRAGFS